MADDVALRHTVEPARRRGIAGTVLVHKIAGAAAMEGRSVEEVAALAREAADEIGSMGVALGSCTLPAAGRPSFVLKENEIEFGLGIHGEQGVERASIETSERLVERVIATIVEDRAIEAGDRVALLVNGLGATPPMELSIVLRDALKILERRKINVERAWCGVFMSALDMPGFSLSLLPVSDRRLELLDARSDAPAWPAYGRLNKNIFVAPTARKPVEPAPHAGRHASALRTAVTHAAQALIAREAELTDSMRKQATETSARVWRAGARRSSPFPMRVGLRPRLRSRVSATVCGGR